jgi:hypothetical protein
MRFPSNAGVFTIKYVQAKSLSVEEWVKFLITAEKYKELFSVT